MKHGLLSKTLVSFPLVFETRVETARGEGSCSSAGDAVKCESECRMRGGNPRTCLGVRIWKSMEN